jgi:cytochrome c oxidase subunit 2
MTLALLLAACAGGVVGDNPTGDANPPGFTPGQVVTEQGKAAVDLYMLTFVIATVVFFLVEGLLLLIALRYRRRKGDNVLPTQTHGNNNLEFLWTIVPAIVVTVLFVAALITLTEKTDAKTPNPDVTVDVSGFQWQWTFAYPGYKNNQGEPIAFTGAGTQGPVMVLPVNQTIRFRISAKDVIHSFYVPQFFYKKDAIPGRTNEFEITIQDPGTYGGQCAEFCGLSHSQMYFTVNAVTRAEFDTWAANAQAQANATPPPAPSGAAKVVVKSVSIAAGFDPSTLSAPADSPITFELQNVDTTAPHNIAVRKGNTDGTDWVGMPFANPGQTAVYQAPALKAGSYEFYCAIHPTMKGTLTVGS